METMVQTNDGFEIAEVDLKLRGPGDLMGTRKSGCLIFKLPIWFGTEILLLARKLCLEIVQRRFRHAKPEHTVCVLFL
jgi:ATP-dependent DNA helicase RecG